MSGHVRAARTHLELASQVTDDSGRALHLAGAQAEATLALVEQQRIANLIALGSIRIGPNDTPALRHLIVEPKNEYDVQPTAAISEGLGLS